MGLVTISRFISIFLFIVIAIPIVSSAASAPALEINDEQYEPGATVNSFTVEEATVPEGGFIVIYKNGEQIGVSDYLSSGTHSNITIPLQTSLSDSGTLIGVLYKDSNYNQQFSTKWDVRYTSQGQPVTDSSQVIIPTQTANPDPAPTPEPNSEPTVPIDDRILAVIGLGSIVIVMGVAGFIYKRYQEKINSNR